MAAGQLRKTDGPVPSIFDENAEADRLQRKRELRRIRSVLLTTALLILLPGLLRALLPGTTVPNALPYWGYVAAVVIVYGALGIAAVRRPFTALLAGLIAYAALQAAIIWSAPASIYQGWLFRVIILLNLLMPLQRAYALQRGDRRMGGA